MDSPSHYLVRGVGKLPEAWEISRWPIFFFPLLLAIVGLNRHGSHQWEPQP